MLKTKTVYLLVQKNPKTLEEKVCGLISSEEKAYIWASSMNREFRKIVVDDPEVISMCV